MANKGAYVTREAMRRRRGKNWHGTAFLVEAILLLAFVAASIAVFMQLFGHANIRGEQSEHLSEAIVEASNVAEDFAIDPLSVEPSFQTEAGYQVTCEIDAEPQAAGTLYRAHIEVALDGEELYELETAKYESEVS